jgi:hypothetical protein
MKEVLLIKELIKESQDEIDNILSTCSCLDTLKKNNIGLYNQILALRIKQAKFRIKLASYLTEYGRKKIKGDQTN